MPRERFSLRYLSALLVCETASGKAVFNAEGKEHGGYAEKSPNAGVYRQYRASSWIKRSSF